MNSGRLLVAGLVALLATTASAATFAVNSTNDSGAGTLRQAILDANATPGADTITFAIPGAGVHTIDVSSDLPEINETVTIDGSTQPGTTTLPLIEISSGNFVNFGFLIKADGTTIRGLIINGFDTAIFVDADVRATISGNFIGTDSSGAVASSPRTTAVVVEGFARVGGPTAADGNVFGGYYQAVYLNGTTSGGGNPTTIQNNFIGVDRSRTTRLSPDGATGVTNYATGPTMTRDNVIANVYTGVETSGPGHSVLTNLIYDLVPPSWSSEYPLWAINAYDTQPLSLFSASTDGVATLVNGNTSSPLNDVYLLQLFGTPTNVREARSFIAEGSNTPLANAFTFRFAGAATPGQYVTATETNVASGSTVSLSYPVQVTVSPGVSESFLPVSIGQNDVSILTIHLTDVDLVNPITGVALVSNLPSGMVNATSPAPTSNCAGASFALTPGDSTFTVSGMTIPANGGCDVNVAVTAAAVGNYVHTTAIGDVTSTSNGSNISAASATLSVLPHPTVSKQFVSATIAQGGTSTLTIMLANSSATAMTGATFTDTYPAGLVNNGTPTSNCGGTLASTSNSVSLNGGTIPPSGNCSISINVTSATSGSYGNALPLGGLTTSNAGANSVAAGATLTVNPLPPVVTKSFTPATIAPTASSTLTVTLTNNSATAVNGVTFTDNYPSGLINAASPAATTGCGGVATATAGGNTLIFSGGTVPANSQCTVTVQVTSATANSYQNDLAVGAVTSSNATPSTTAASATLSVVTLGAIGATKSFAPTSFQQSGTSTMTITLTNVNPTAINGITFTDNYPSGLTNTTPLTMTNSCGGTVTTSAGGNSLALSGGTVAANSTCSITALVTASVAGTYTNTIAANAITSSNANPNASAATAAVTANPLPAVPSQSFVPNVISIGGTSRFTITLTNTSAVAITGAAINHAFPSGITAAATPNVSSTCGAGVVALASSIALTNGVIPANGSCAIALDITGNASGLFTDTIAAGAVTASNAAPSTATSTASLTIRLLGPTVAKTFSATTLAVGPPSTLTITLTNPNASAITGVTFTDNYPTGMLNTSVPAPTSSCGGTVTASANGTFLALAGGTIPANGNCTVTAIITVTSGLPLTNTVPAGSVISANSDPSAGPAASASVNVAAIPVLPPHVLLMLGAMLAVIGVLAARRG